MLRGLPREQFIGLVIAAAVLASIAVLIDAGRTGRESNHAVARRVNAANVLTVVQLTKSGQHQDPSRSRAEELHILDMPVVSVWRCSLLRADVRIDLRDASSGPKADALAKVMAGRHPIGTTQRLYVIRPGMPRLVDSLDGLRGLVKIDTSDKALEFVRLRTNPDLRYLLTAGYPPEAEVLSSSELRRLTNYGIGSFPIMTPRPSDATATEYVFGNYGVLSDTGFKIGGFSEPWVRALQNRAGYEIVRWMFAQVPLSASPTHKPNSLLHLLSDVVYQIRETVGPDGRYSRTQLEMKPAPDLPNTEWFYNIPYI